MKVEQRIQRFVDKHRNELMLEHFQVVRLLGWTDREDDDYYYVLLERVYGIGNRVCLLSCCGRPVPFKLSVRERKRLEEVWYLNECGVIAGLAMAEEKGIVVK
jgi:hypothetical protein